MYYIHNSKKPFKSKALLLGAVLIPFILNLLFCFFSAIEADNFYVYDRHCKSSMGVVEGFDENESVRPSQELGKSKEKLLIIMNFVPLSPSIVCT